MNDGDEVKGKTMKTQTEAQQIADELESTPFQSTRYEAAAELRRLEAANAELLEALKHTTVHLIAAVSLLEAGGKKAAASNKIFELMLTDYKASIEQARAATAKHGGAA